MEASSLHPKRRRLRSATPSRPRNRRPRTSLSFLFVLLTSSAGASAQSLYFTSPSPNALTALGSPLNFTTGSSIPISWQSDFASTTLRVWQGPMNDGSFVGEVLSQGNSPAQNTFTWTARRPDGSSGAGCYLELVNEEDSECGGCKADSVGFVVAGLSDDSGESAGEVSSGAASATATSGIGAMTTSSGAASRTTSSSGSSTASASHATQSTTSSSHTASSTASSSTKSTSLPAITSESSTNSTENTTNDRSHHSLAIGLGVGLGVGIPLLLALLALCAFCLLRRRKRKERGGSATPSDTGPIISQPHFETQEANGAANSPGHDERQPLHAPNHVAATYFAPESSARRPTTGRRSNASRTSAGAVSVASSYHGPFEFEPNTDFDARSVASEIHDAALRPGGLANHDRAGTPGSQRSRGASRRGVLGSIEEDGRNPMETSVTHGTGQSDWPLPASMLPLGTKMPPNGAVSSSHWGARRAF